MPERPHDEPGNDAMLADAGVAYEDVVRQEEDATALSNTEDELLDETDEADDEPGEDFPPREPAGLDADTGFDPLPAP